MSKKIFTLALSLMLVVSLSACGAKTDKERFRDATVEIACDVIKPSLENLEAMADPAKLQEIEEKTLEILKKHGFENQEEYEQLGEQFETDAEFKKEVEDAATAKCGSLDPSAE